MRSRLRSEDGLTLVELLVAAAMSTILIGAACAMLISAVHGQPSLSKRAQNISTARFALERMTREIRNGIVVYKATGSQVIFKTLVRRTECGAGPEENPSISAIECRVTYTCTTTACTRTETKPTVESGGVSEVLIGDLDSSKVFNFEPPTEPSFIGITLHMPDPEGRGDLVVTDGAGLRIQSFTG